MAKYGNISEKENVHISVSIYLQYHQPSEPELPRVVFKLANDLT